MRQLISRGVMSQRVMTAPAASFMPTAVTYTVSTSMRHLHYSEQVPALAQAAQQKGYKSNIWCSEEDDGWWIKDSTHVKPEEVNNYVEAFVPKLIQLFNGDQLEGSHRLESVDKHTSFSTKRPYSGRFADALEQRAAEKGYTSKWWFAPSQVKKNGLNKIRNATPHNIALTVKGRLYNAEQYESPEAITLVPISGATRWRIASDISTDLITFMLENEFNNGLFYTEAELNSNNLVAKPGSKPYRAPTNYSRMYNVEQFEEASLVGVDLATDPDQHTNVITGYALPKTMDDAVRETSFKSKLWIAEKDVSARGFQLKEGAEPVVPFVAMYNVQQLVTPADGFQLAGTRQS